MKKGSSVFSRSSTTTTSPGKSFRTEKSSFGSEAEGLCMMLRSFSLRNGSAETVTLFILHSLSSPGSSSPFSPPTFGVRNATINQRRARGSSCMLGSMLMLAISGAPFPLPSQMFLSESGWFGLCSPADGEPSSGWEAGSVCCSDGLCQWGNQAPLVPDLWVVVDAAQKSDHVTAACFHQCKRSIICPNGSLMVDHRLAECTQDAFWIPSLKSISIPLQSPHAFSIVTLLVS